MVVITATTTIIPITRHINFSTEHLLCSLRTTEGDEGTESDIEIKNGKKSVLRKNTARCRCGGGHGDMAKAGIRSNLILYYFYIVYTHMSWKQYKRKCHVWFGISLVFCEK